MCVGAQVAKCHLHTAVMLSKQRQHGEAVRCNGQVLQLVDEGKLEDGGPSAEKVCMVAVCYHNIAVDQLLMQQVRSDSDDDSCAFVRGCVPGVLGFRAIAVLCVCVCVGVAGVRCKKRVYRRKMPVGWRGCV